MVFNQQGSDVKAGGTAHQCPHRQGNFQEVPVKFDCLEFPGFSCLAFQTHSSGGWQSLYHSKVALSDSYTLICALLVDSA